MEFVLTPAKPGGGRVRGARAFLPEEAAVLSVAFAGVLAAALLSFVLITWEQKRRTPWEQEQIETAWRDFLLGWSTTWGYLKRLRLRDTVGSAADTWTLWVLWKHKSPAGRVTTWLMRAALAVAIAAAGWDWPKVVLRLIEKFC